MSAVLALLLIGAACGYLAGRALHMPVPPEPGDPTQEAGDGWIDVPRPLTYAEMPETAYRDEWSGAPTGTSFRTTGGNRWTRP